MIATILDAKSWLEKHGLYVACNDDRSLWIAAHVSDVGDGVKLSTDACGLFWDSDRWVAVFPADGVLTFEVPGELEVLSALILTVYRRYRESEISLKEAFRQAVEDADQYLVGRSLSRT